MATLLLPPPALKLEHPRAGRSKLARISISSAMAGERSIRDALPRRLRGSRLPGDSTARPPRSLSGSMTTLPAGGRQCLRPRQRPGDSSPAARGRSSAGSRRLKRQAGRSEPAFLRGGTPPAAQFGAGDRLFAHVYLEPGTRPRRSCSSSTIGDWNHRAFWGDDVIDLGQADSPERRARGSAARGRAMGASGSRRRCSRVCKPGTNSTAWPSPNTAARVYLGQGRRGVASRRQARQGFARQLAWEQFQRRTQRSHSPPEDCKAARRNDPAKRTPRTAHGSFATTSLTSSMRRPRAVFDPLHTAARRALKRGTREVFDHSIPRTLITRGTRSAARHAHRDRARRL